MTRSPGFLHWIFPAMLAMVALTVLLSDRDLSQALAELQMGTASVSHPALIWAQRLVSLLLLGVAGERIATHIAARQRVPSPTLAAAFVVFWLATVAAPAVFGAHPRFVHEYLYTLVIGLAAVLTTGRERDKILEVSRNALLAFLLASLLLIPVKPAMVLDQSYIQGLLPGLPRLAGVAIHAVALGMFAQIFLLCLWYRPFGSGWANLCAWAIGGTALLLAQSKTAWIAFFLCMACMLAVRHGSSSWRRIGDPRQRDFAIVAFAGVMAVVFAALAVLLLGDVQEQVSSFLDTSEGMQLMSLTGRDRIWAVAIGEWQSSPVFGYGPDLWDAAFRARIGMPNATSAHNQFMDTLARSGSVGAAALVLYAGVLLALSLKYAGATRGLSLALFVALALRSISEVPLVLLGYGTEFFTHLLLIVTLASAAREQRAGAPSRTGSIYRAAS